MALSLIDARKAEAAETAIAERFATLAPRLQARPAAPPFRAFLEAAWPLIEPATPFIGGYHVDAICEHLTAITRGALQNLIINIPPRHTKSSLVAVLWPVWEWIDAPHLQAVFASYGLALSIRDSLKRRRLLESAWFRAQWGDRFCLTTDQNAKTRYENTATGVHLATSVGGIGTGEGGDRIIVDDPHNAEQIDSDTIRQSVLDWWDGAMATRGNQPRAVARVIVMQRLHEADLVGHLLAKMQTGGTQYDHLVLPAEYEPKAQLCLAGLAHDPRTEPGQLLSPERFDAAAMATITADLGEQRAAGQLQQRPAPAGGGVFKRAWWEDGRNRYDATHPGRTVNCLARWLSLDTALKDAEDNDYTSCAVFELQPDYRLALRDLWLERLEFPALLSAIEADATRWNHDGKLRGVILEDKGSGTSAGQSLRHAAPDWLAELLVMFVPLGSKTYRARQASLWCAKGCVLLPHISEAVPWLDGFAGPDGRLWKFPAVAHDDDVDAFDQAIIYLENYLAEGFRARGGTTEEAA